MSVFNSGVEWKLFHCGGSRRSIKRPNVFSFQGRSRRQLERGMDSFFIALEGTAINRSNVAFKLRRRMAFLFQRGIGQKIFDGKWLPNN